MKILGRILIIALAALASLTCKKDDNPVVNVTNVQPSEEAISLTSQGWVAFEARDYPGALGFFTQATAKNNLYADAYNGMGWSYARLDSLGKAQQFFDVTLGLQPDFIDAYAGRSFVSLARGDYDAALDAVARVQASASFYAFRHDPDISMNDLLLVKVQSYFLLQNYPAAQQIINFLDPTNRLDPASPNYLEDLALEIELLRSIV